LWYLFVAVWILFPLLNIWAICEPLLRRFLRVGCAFLSTITVMHGGAIPRCAVSAYCIEYPAIGRWRVD
jgi:hypothetical protein